MLRFLGISVGFWLTAHALKIRKGYFDGFGKPQKREQYPLYVISYGILLDSNFVFHQLHVDRAIHHCYLRSALAQVIPLRQLDVFYIYSDINEQYYY